MSAASPLPCLVRRGLGPGAARWHGQCGLPHFDQDGLCGYAIKNEGFTEFARGGEKGLWFSRTDTGDNRLVLAESAIDALSHAQIFPDEKTRYASIGGQMNPLQPGLIKAAILKMSGASEIIAAMDADADGRKLLEVVRRTVFETARSDLCFTSSCPKARKIRTMFLGRSCALLSLTQFLGPRFSGS